MRTKWNCLLWLFECKSSCKQEEKLNNYAQRFDIWYPCVWRETLYLRIHIHLNSGSQFSFLFCVLGFHRKWVGFETIICHLCCKRESFISYKRNMAQNLAMNSLNLEKMYYKDWSRPFWLWHMWYEVILADANLEQLSNSCRASLLRIKFTE